MLDPKRALNRRMKLRQGVQMKDLKFSLFPKVIEILQAKSATVANVILGTTPRMKLSCARYQLINAIRHAWLICHEGCGSISYGRQTDKHGDHSGPLHDFIVSLTQLLQCAPNTDWLHREIRSLDQQMHPGITMP
ncbi:hypothetical protein [Pseudomonas sp. 6D_7.1_Bac1]|jgi:hypothetical protein|uniref:hypothetical protein n=1 Tax=Pseudomonas sp. 6D_7.1_Bac1 TaxID=2971615 RepID=UPI0021C671D3|nr:hypothetical protein [Pseudomonas sp. 6D_7.1_Bac1]MCU1748026.1 hypothetical protein [Pseudomonas sp. 6D_7.1_Bac1]